MSELWSYILDQLHNNNFLSGGAVLMVVGALGALLRKWPAKIWDIVRARFVTVVDIPDRDPAFQWINDWLAVHPYGAEKARLLTVRTAREPASQDALDDQSEDCDCADCEAKRAVIRSSQPKIIFSPAPGSHYFFYRGRFVVLNRTRKDAEGHRADSGLGIRECFTLTLFSRSRSLVTKLLEEARELAHPKTDERLAILVPEFNNWATKARINPRKIETVVLAEGIMERVLERIKRFRKSSAWYFERGIPWRLGILFPGPPGTGKSSGVLAIASYYRMDIALLSLNAHKLSDDSLRDLLCSVPRNAIVLIEDVDCVFDKRNSKKDKDNAVTFSGLLNAIDGVAAGEGRILIMTTNHPEKLDPALIRPGRIDLTEPIELPNHDQRVRLFKRFYPDNCCLAEKFAKAIEPNVSMAELQGHMLKYSDSADAAMFHVDELEDLGPAVEVDTTPRVEQGKRKFDV